MDTDQLMDHSNDYMIPLDDSYIFEGNSLYLNLELAWNRLHSSQMLNLNNSIWIYRSMICKSCIHLNNLMFFHILMDLLELVEVLLEVWKFNKTKNIHLNGNNSTFWTTFRESSIAKTVNGTVWVRGTVIFCSFIVIG